MKVLLLIVSALFLFACASHPPSIQIVESLEDIPLIEEEYEAPLARLELGMSKGQVLALFPNVERECYESGKCHFTVFDERMVQIDRRLQDLDLLTGGLMSVLALTCLVAEETCKEALVAALNVGVASVIANDEIKSGKRSVSTVVASAILLNKGYLGVSMEQQPRAPSKAELSGVFTLIQWINIEFNNGVVTEWAINEPLNQYKPKSYKNELPDLDEALGLNSKK